MSTTVEPATFTQAIDRLREAWQPLRDAFRSLGEAFLRALRLAYDALGRWLQPHRHGRHVQRRDRVLRRTERRRQARMLRRQRRAR